MTKGTSVLSLMLAGAMVLGPALAFAQGGGAGGGSGAGAGAGSGSGGTGGASGGNTTSPAMPGPTQPKPSGTNVSSTGSPAASPSTTPSTSGAGSTSPSASPTSGGFQGRHTMTGEVTEIDDKSGKFSLKTKEGTLDLHAPPTALSGVKKGDQLSVEIAVRPMR